MSYFQVCSTDGRHSPIDLPNNTSVALGRSPVTKITDKLCSRQHVTLVADYKDGTVTLEQHGLNSATIDGEEVPKGQTKTLKPNDKFCMVANCYEYNITCNQKKGEEKTQQKRTINDFLGVKSKRQKVSDVAEQTSEEIEVQKKLSLLQKSNLLIPSMNKSKKEQKDLPSHSPLWIKSDSTSGWSEHEDLLIYDPPGLFNSSKIAAFDMDGTLITTASGKTFAVDHNDWRILYAEIPGRLKSLHRDEFKILIITNQLGIGKGKIAPKDFKVKIGNLLKKLGIPIQVIAITKRSANRKPNIGTWEWLQKLGNGGISINMSDCFYIGDAAGRPKDWAPKKKKDFSCADRLFALNLGIQFKTPEEFFMSQKPAKFNMPEFDPKSVNENVNLIEGSGDVVSKKQEVIIMVGYPASGKSFFSKQYLVSKGYTCVNRDTMKTWQKCVAACNQALANGQSVVVDNTNPDKAGRKRYIDAAKSHGCDCRCFVFQVSMEHARHNNRYRELSLSEHDKVPDFVFYQYRKAYEEPSLPEGFQSIVKVNFVPNFLNDDMRKKYFLYND